MSDLKIMPVPQGWITRREAADRAGITLGTLTSWVKLGRVESAKIYCEQSHRYLLWVNPNSLPSEDVRRSWLGRNNLLGDWAPDDGFHDPVPEGQCHNLMCDRPESPRSALRLCAEHEMVLRSQKGALRRKPDRCSDCQYPLGIHNTTGRCTGCSAKHNGKQRIA